MPNFVSAKYMFAMVPRDRTVHNKKKRKENVYIYTLNEANSEMHIRQADLFNLLSH